MMAKARRAIFLSWSSSVTWCLRKQDTVPVPSCEVEFMAETEDARHVLWLQELLSEVTCRSCEKVVI